MNNEVEPTDAELAEQARAIERAQVLLQPCPVCWVEPVPLANSVDPKWDLPRASHPIWHLSGCPLEDD